MALKGVMLLLAAAAPTAAQRGLISRFAAATLRARGGNGTVPSAACVMEHCSAKLAACAADTGCRSGMLCTGGCPKGNQTCIFQCESDFEDAAYTDLLRCMFGTADCTGGMADFDPYQACRPLARAAPLATFRGAPLTAAAARRMLARGQQQGAWVVAGGLSHAYDCFDCQFQWYNDNGDGTLEYLAEYEVHRSNGSARWNVADYRVTSPFPGAPGRMQFNASDYGGLFHAEEWRLLAADETTDDPQWLALYYCGAAPGVREAYEGSCLLTPDGALPADPAADKAWRGAYAAAGITLGCFPETKHCDGHLLPPFPPPSAAAR